MHIDSKWKSHINTCNSTSGFCQYFNQHALDQVSDFVSSQNQLRQHRMRLVHLNEQKERDWKGDANEHCKP